MLESNCSLLEWHLLAQALFVVGLEKQGHHQGTPRPLLERTDDLGVAVSSSY